MAKKLIANMNEAMRTIREKASFADDKQADEILNVYREAMMQYCVVQTI